MTLEAWLMIVGAALWLTGELWGAHTRRNGDTTSEVVWALERKLPIVRVVLGAFIVSLFFHLVFGWRLFP